MKKEWQNIHYGSLRQLDRALRRYCPEGQSRTVQWLSSVTKQSERSVRRNIDEMKHQLEAPIAYDRQQGYHYKDPTWFFPEKIVAVNLSVIKALQESAESAKKSGCSDLAKNIRELIGNLGPAGSRCEKHAAVSGLVCRAASQGYLTYSDIAEMLPRNVTDPDEIECYFQLLRGMDISIIREEDVLATNNDMIDAIQNLWKQLPLEKQYDWKLPQKCPIRIPNEISGAFEKNVFLKNNFRSSLKHPGDWKNYFWIIQDWGGIRAFKDNEQNRARIKDFNDQLKSKKLTSESHSRLPSLSKLASFGNPDAYAIYDSRAVFALNWLLFCHQDIPALFPQPPSRNKSILGMDTQTLFRLSGRKYTVRPFTTAYFEYCNMLKDLSKKALNKKQPFYLEMLLFVAAKEWVPNDIKSRTLVTIK